MFEKVNPAHPDKVADRIAGRIVDFAYRVDPNPRIAVEVLLGHGEGFILIETDVLLSVRNVLDLFPEYKNLNLNVKIVKQDKYLNENKGCGDNGIFKGCPVSIEQRKLTTQAKYLYNSFGEDGKYILNDDKLIICQSYAKEEDLRLAYPSAVINPLGYWTGGLDVDSGATNRKLGSDMGDAVTGGGLHGKDLSKADVSVNIYCHLKAQKTGKEVKAFCAIGDKEVSFDDGEKVPFEEIKSVAREYINSIGSFESLAEWGLIR